MTDFLHPLISIGNGRDHIHVRAVNLDRLTPELEPIVWAIDDWNRNYKLGVIFECSVGDGRLLMSQST